MLRRCTDVIFQSSSPFAKSMFFISHALELSSLLPAGYVWGFNTQNFFNEYYPTTSTGRWLSWIPLVGGSMGVIFGGFISDRFVKKSGPVARIWVLIASLVSTLGVHTPL